jgi:predicted enzyme related to lactoylglutathione lyase
MAHDFQVVVDCAHPHELADWWADVLGWNPEPSDEAFIRRMIDEGLATEDDTTTHQGVLVWATGAAIRPPEPSEGFGRRILFQKVPEAKTVKNRLHLDVRVGKDNQEAERDRLVAAGATFLHEGHEGPNRWFTLADPEGNEFCLA